MMVERRTDGEEDLSPVGSRRDARKCPGTAGLEVQIGRE